MFFLPVQSFRGFETEFDIVPLAEDLLRGPECWICYDPDASDAGPMINPCDCKGDVGAVHHDCLRRWLVESADNPDALNCKVRSPYSRGGQN